MLRPGALTSLPSAFPSALLRVVALVIVCCGLVTVAIAQCANQWQVVGGLASTDDVVRATTSWDPDGPGPLPVRLVVGGSFWRAGPLTTRGIAACDLATGIWSPLGGGPASLHVRALLARTNGDLLAAGQFSVIGGVGASNVARWSGSTWVPFGSGLNGPVNALALMPNGDVVAGGEFTASGATPMSRVARWDGVTWTAMGSGVDATVTSLAVLPSGDVVAADRS
jgi:hypothetical protein